MGFTTLSELSAKNLGFSAHEVAEETSHDRTLDLVERHASRG